MGGAEREGGLQQRLCNVALQEMKLHPEQGEEGATQRWVRRGGQVGGDKVTGAEQRLSGVEATL